MDYLETAPTEEFFLNRTELRSKSTPGLIEHGPFRCASLELPWMNGMNLHGQSCIPPGRYKLFSRLSPKLGRTVLGLADVPGRDQIEMHPANYVSQLLGCIAAGLRIDNDSLGISRQAFECVLALVEAYEHDGKECWITISNPPEADEAGSSPRA